MNFGQIFQLLLPVILSLLKGINRSPVEAQQAFAERLLATPEMQEGQQDAQQGLPEGAQAAMSGADLGYWFTLLLPFIIRILEALQSMPPQQLQAVADAALYEMQGGDVQQEYAADQEQAQPQHQPQQPQADQQVGPNNPA